LLQEQLAASLLPAGEEVKASQFVHSRSPGAKYLPTKHVWQFEIESEALFGE